TSCTFETKDCLTYQDKYKELLPEIEKEVEDLKNVLTLDIYQQVERAKQLAEQQKYQEAYELLEGLKSQLLKLQLKQAMIEGKETLLDVGRFVKDNSNYWLLSGMVILTVLTGYYVREIPFRRYWYKLKPVPQVRVEQVESTPITQSTIASKPLDEWRRKSYLNLDEQLKRLDSLLQEVKVPEQKAKALKLTKLKGKESLDMPRNAIIKNKEELQQWMESMISFGMPDHRIKELVKKTTKLPDREVNISLHQLKAASLLKKKYAIDNKAAEELKRFIYKEFKNGSSPKQVIKELVQEGWDEKVIELYVMSHYAV
ncbi:MAG: hypothetical protein AABX05_05950, partial [Nanoarchaeota archaeon]